MARPSALEDDGLVYVQLGEDGVVHLDGGRAVPLPNIPFPIRRQDLEVFEGGDELPVSVLVEGTLAALVRVEEGEVAENYRRFLFTVEPNVDQLLVAEALTLAREDKVQRARDRFQALVHLCPDHAAGWMNLGLCAMDLARRVPVEGARYTSEALEAFLRATEVDDRLAPAHFYLGCLYRDHGDARSARQAWRRCVSLGPYESEVALSARCMLAQFEERQDLDTVFEHGCLAVFEGRFEEALSLLARVVSSRPDAWQAHFFQGLAYRLRGDYAAATEAYRVVVRLRPDEPEAWNELGLCQLEQGMTPEAERSLETALELAPDDPRVLSNLGLMMLRRGEREAALQLFMEAQEMDPEEPMTREYMQLAAELPS